MAVNFSYLVALPVPPPWQNQLAAVQERLRPAGWHITIGPHLTLVAPGAAQLEIAAAARSFGQATQSYQPMTISYPAIGSFTGRGLSTLFLKPVATNELYELQRKLVIMASAWQDTSRSQRRPFVPHVTLVNRLPEARAAVVAGQLSSLAPLELKFGQICLFAKRPKDQKWLQII